MKPTPKKELFGPKRSVSFLKPVEMAILEEAERAGLSYVDVVRRVVHEAFAEKLAPMHAKSA